MKYSVSLWHAWKKCQTHSEYDLFFSGAVPLSWHVRTQLLTVPFLMYLKNPHILLWVLHVAKCCSLNLRSLGSHTGFFLF